MDEAAKKSALRMVPYGLYLVGSRERDATDPAQHLNAFIGSWVTQTSFKPPMVALGVKKDARSNAMIRESGVFTLSVLGTGQKNLAQAFFKDFAVAPEGPTRGTMAGVPYEIEPATGCPIFPDLPAWLACRVTDRIDGANDHTLFVGEVIDAGFRGPPEPLLREETGWVYAG